MTLHPQAKLPLPGGEGVGGWGSAQRVGAGVVHPHPTLPLKGEEI